MTAGALPAGAAIAGGRGRRLAPRRLLVPVPALGRALLLSGGAALVLAPLYVDLSWWIAVGIATCVFSVVHGAGAAYRAVWLPGVMAFAASVQWMLAAWSDYVFANRMGIGAEEYFTFAGPATLLFVLGLYLPFWRTRFVPAEVAAPASAAESERMTATCKLMVAGGVFVKIFVLPYTPMSVRYAGSLVALLSIVGCVGLVLLAARRWSVWVLVTFAPIAFGNAVDLQFLDSLQFIFCLGCVIVYRFRPRRSTILMLVVPAVLLFQAISAFKALSRDELRQQEMTSSARATTTSQTLVDFVRKPSVLFAPDILARSAGRLNEGWVTSRLLAWMPTAEPFARGETIVGGLRSAVLPRILDPGKFVVGGQDIIPRFTGIKLLNATAMGLSLPGEMYANFGLWGSWIGTFVCALFLGMLYKVFQRRAQASIMWWAWVPFVFYSALSPEQGFAENANHIAKSLLVMWAVVRFMPAWRRLPRRVVRAGAGTRRVDPGPITGHALPASH